MLNASVVLYLTDKLQHVSSGLVYLLVAALVFGEAAIFLGFVLPGETAVIVAGVVASQGRVNVALVCAVVVVAAVLGDSVGYEVGQRFGPRLITLPLIRKRRVAIERALDGLKRRGPIYVFVGRFTAFLRAVMPSLAGMSELSYRRFLVANAAGGLTWGVGYTLLGYFAGRSLPSIEKYSGWATLALLAVMVALFITLHYAKKGRDARADARWLIEHPGDSTQDVE